LAVRPSESLGLINPLNAELNPIRHLLALLEAHHIFNVSGLRVNYRYPFFFVYCLLPPSLNLHLPYISIIKLLYK